MIRSCTCCSPGRTTNRTLLGQILIFRNPKSHTVSFIKSCPVRKRADFHGFMGASSSPCGCLWSSSSHRQKHSAPYFSRTKKSLKQPDNWRLGFTFVCTSPPPPTKICNIGFYLVAFPGCSKLLSFMYNLISCMLFFLILKIKFFFQFITWPIRIVAKTSFYRTIVTTYESKSSWSIHD
jgi:hypothetical protein